MCSSEINLDKPKYLHCFDQHQLVSLLSIPLYSFLHILLLQTTANKMVQHENQKSSSFIGPANLPTIQDQKQFYSLAGVNDTGYNSERKLYHTECCPLRQACQAVETRKFS